MNKKIEMSARQYIGLGQVPIGIGAVLKGWDVDPEKFLDPDNLPVVDFRAMGPECPHDCRQCFTDKNRHTLTLAEIKKVIRQLAERKTRGIDFVGEGEPTLDKIFFEIIEYTARQGIVPIVFTEAAARLRRPAFVDRLKELDASVVIKCDSLFNEKYQNQAVGDKKGKYFHRRNEALQLLMASGYNKTNSDGTTRLGFDMVITKQNIHEVPELLRFCRNTNIWVIFSFYLPAGRSGKMSFDTSLEPSPIQKNDLRRLVQQIDKDEFSFDHKTWNNFITMPCVERMQIYGSGLVSPCPGNEIIMGSVNRNSIEFLNERILKRFPQHNPDCFTGNCHYRQRT